MDDGSFLSLIQDVHCNILLVNGQYQLREERWFFFWGPGGWPHVSFLNEGECDLEW